MYHAHPRGKVGSFTIPSYVFPAAVAARWQTVASRIRADSPGQSLLPLKPHVYAPTQQGYGDDLACMYEARTGRGAPNDRATYASHASAWMPRLIRAGQRGDLIRDGSTGECPGLSTRVPQALHVRAHAHVNVRTSGPSLV